MKYCYIFISFFLISYGNCLLVEELEVDTQFGKIKGTERDHFTSFEGIPYAEAPVGELRFEPPVPFHTKVCQLIFITNFYSKTCFF